MRHVVILASLCLASTALATPFDMAYQGRLLDTSGTPIEGTHTLELTLHGSASSHTGETFLNVPFTGGYFAVTLSDVDSQWLSTPVSVGISVDGQAEMDPLTPLTTSPMAGHAQTSDAVRAMSSPSGACAMGEVVFDTVAGDLRICKTGQWPQGLSNDGTRWTWADGSAARSCYDYQNPPDDQHVYGGQGDGVYAIDPQDSGSPFDALCDMSTDGGGWTLVASVDPSSQEHLTPNAVRPTSLTTLSNYGKFTDVLINAIKDDAQGGRDEIRLEASDSFTMTWDDCPFTANAAAAQGCEHGAAPSHYGLSLNTGWEGYPAGCWITYGWTASGSIGIRGSNGVCGYSSSNTSGSVWVR